MASYSPSSTKGIALEEVTLSCRDGGSQDSSSSFSRLLQPDVRRLEDLRVVEALYRPLSLESLHCQDSLHHGNHSIS